MRMDWKLALVVFVWFLPAIGILLLCRCWQQSLTAIGTWLLALGVFFALWQVRQMKRSTNAQLAVGLLQVLRSENRQKILRDYIYKFKKPITKSYVEKEMTDDDRNNINIALDHLDILGALVNQGVIDESLAIEGYAGATVLRCWYQLHNYIKWEREHVRGSNVYAHLEDLACRTLHYAKKNHPEPNWVTLKPSKEVRRIDIVAELTRKRELAPKRLKEQALQQ